MVRGYPDACNRGGECVTLVRLVDGVICGDVGAPVSCAGAVNVQVDGVVSV